MKQHRNARRTMELRRQAALLASLGTPCLIHNPPKNSADYVAQRDSLATELLHRATGEDVCVVLAALATAAGAILGAGSVNAHHLAEGLEALVAEVRSSAANQSAARAGLLR